MKDKFLLNKENFLLQKAFNILTSRVMNSLLIALYKFIGNRNDLGQRDKALKKLVGRGGRSDQVGKMGVLGCLRNYRNRWLKAEKTGEMLVKCQGGKVWEAVLRLRGVWEDGVSGGEKSFGGKGEWSVVEVLKCERVRAEKSLFN